MIVGHFAGIGDLNKRVESLKSSLRNKAIRIAMNKASAVVKAAAVAAAPRGSGALSKSIRIKVKQYKSSKVWVSIIGPTSKYTYKGRRPSRYAHLIERGSRHNSPSEFLRSALTSTQSRFAEILLQAIADQVEKLAK